MQLDLWSVISDGVLSVVYESRRVSVLHGGRLSVVCYRRMSVVHRRLSVVCICSLAHIWFNILPGFNFRSVDTNEVKLRNPVPRVNRMINFIYTFLTKFKCKPPRLCECWFKYYYVQCTIKTTCCVLNVTDSYR